MLEVEELLPDGGLLVANCRVRHVVRVKVLQRLLEEMLEDKEIDKLGFVVAVDIRDVFGQKLRHIAKVAVRPDLLEARAVGIGRRATRAK